MTVGTEGIAFLSLKDGSFLGRLLTSPVVELSVLHVLVDGRVMVHDGFQYFASIDIPLKITRYDDKRVGTLRNNRPGEESKLTPIITQDFFQLRNEIAELKRDNLIHKFDICAL